MTIGRRVRTMAGALMAILLTLLAGTAGAEGQYTVFSWDSFETGVMPESLQMKFQASSDTVGVVDLAAPTAPPGIRNGVAQVECGRYGILLAPDPNRKFVSLVNPLTLNRQQLGASGKALFQADFYLPPVGEEISTLAVLAVARDEQNRQSIWKMYRFGVYNGTKLFFAYADNAKKQGSAVTTRTQPLDDMGLERPGWHRFQIVFEGQNKIICAVDGRATSFSPVTEPSLTELQAGVMVTTQVDHQVLCYSDNLSIQWTPEDIPLPESPWAGGATTAFPAVPAQIASQPVAASAEAAPAAAVAAPATIASPAIHWHVSPESAWQQCAAERRPILALFYTKNARLYPALEQLLASDASAQQLVNSFIPLRVDVNQLMGGTLAQKFSVFRVPAFIVIGASGTVTAHAVFDDNTPWPAVAGQLRQALATP